MKKTLFALLLIVAVSCVREDALSMQDTVGKAEESELAGSNYISGEVHVKFSDEMVQLIESDLTEGTLETRSAGLNQTVESLGITSMRRLFPHGGEFEARRRAAGLHKWYVVTYEPTLPQTRAMTELSQVGGIDVVEPVRKIAINSTVPFNDWSSALWGLYNTTNRGIDINVVPVWENYTVGNPDVIVAIVDSGVETSHPDLVDNCLSAKNENYTQNGKIVPEDHGTHVAGTIAAVGNNRLGVCGIAGGDKVANKAGVKIFSQQIFQGDLWGSSALAIVEAAEKGAVICQNSWGYTYETDGDGVNLTPAGREKAKNDKVQDADKAAIDYFITYAGCTASEKPTQRPDSPMKGGLVVFAAGNNNFSNAAPGNYDKVIAVGAIDAEGNRASFSNYGDWVDIAAPGVGILSTTITEGPYGTMSGTSMACPHVSGVAALVLSYCGGQGFTADMLKEKLIEGANVSKTRPADKIGGLLDAYGAITYGDGVTPDKIEGITTSGRGNNIDFSWKLSGTSDDKAAYGVLIVYGTDRAEVERATAKDYGNLGAFAYETSGKIGDDMSCSVGGLEFLTTYYYKVFAYTYSMNYSEASEIGTVTTTANNAPVVRLDAESIEVHPYETVSIELIVSDPDGHAVNVTYVSGSKADVLVQTGSQYAVEITGKNDQEGDYTGVVTVADEYGLSVTLDVPYTILPNHAPERLKEMEDMLLKSKSAEFRIDMAEYVVDSDGETLKYEINIGNPTVAYINATDNMLYGTPLKYGQTDVSVKASDARGESVTFDFKVIVKDPSNPVSCYPTQVKDDLTVSTMEEAQTRIHIVAAGGQTVYDKTASVSALEPAKIDMRHLAPGLYTVWVSYPGHESSHTIVKL